MKAINTDFTYLPAATVEEALALLAEHKDDDYKIIAGGQSLNTMMKHGLLTPEYLIDIKGVTELDYIKYNDNAGLQVGALTTHRTFERNALVQEKYNALVEMEENVASVETRNWGTIVGDLVNADPAADPAPALIALDATFTIASQGATRTVAAEDLAVDLYETLLEPGEIVTEFQIPPLPANSGFYVTKYSQLHGDYALASAAVLLTLDDKKETCVNARIGLGGVDTTPVRATAAEDVLKGKKLTDELFVEAAEAAMGAINPITGIEASADYKRELAGTILKRVAKEALARARKA